MSSVNSPPSGPTGPRGRQRPAPTIDLKATEIASEPVAGSEAAASAPPSAAELAAQAPAMHSSVDEAVAQDGPGPAKAPEADGASRQAKGPTSGARIWPAHPSIAWLPPDFPWRLVAAGIGGAALVLAVWAATGLFSSGGDTSAQSAMEARLARVESRVRDLSSRPASPGVDPKTVEALATRVAKLESAVAAPRPGATIDPALDNRISLLEGQVSALGERIGVVARRTDDIGTTANDSRARIDAIATALAELQKTVRSAPPAIAKSDIDAMANRIAALEKTTKAIEAAIAKRPAGFADDRSGRLGVTAALLKAAVERGDPFAAELAAAKSLAADPKPLAPLEGFASTGLPTSAALARELDELMPKLAQAAGVSARDGGFLDRLQANAERLVRIRPLDEQPGETPDAVVSRVQARAAKADIAGALAELSKLPEPARAPAQAWIEKAQMRQAALDASRRFAANALGALGQPTP